MKPNNIIFYLIVLEIIIIAFEYNTSVIRKIKPVHIFGEYQPFKIAVIIVFFVVFIFTYFLCKYLKINLISAYIFLFLSLILILNYRLKKNKELTTRTISIEDSLKKLNTGDLIIWETEYKISSIFNLIPVIFTGLYHIGLVLKEDNGKIYILECAINKSYCTYTNRKKTGIVLVDYIDRISNKMDWSFFLVKTNLKNYITNKDIKQFFEKNKNKNYMEDNFNCITSYLHFLQENNLLKTNYTIFPLHEDIDTLLDPKFYSIDFEKEMYKVKKEHE